jgi:predicted phage terminase large subunit-like protein
MAVYAGLHLPDQLEKDVGFDKLKHPEFVDGELNLAPRYVPAKHHQIEIECLEMLESGAKVDGRKLDRLLMLAPPGSAKSTYASVIFPAWYLGRHPKHDVIAGSQTQDLADRFGRRCRNLVASDTHRSVFNAGLARDQRAAGAWTTDQGGEYKAVGVAPFAGRRGDLIICDDLIRGYKDADSPTVRNSTWNWILGDLRPRMKPHAKWVYITTRWHSDDPVGRTLPESWNGKSGWIKAKDGEWWYVLSFVAVIETEEEREFDPCEREMGEILWPEWYTEKMLAQERRSQGRRNWNALYQQKPREEEGGILKAMYWREWAHPNPPQCVYVISVYDTAMEEGEENDYSARTSWGVFWHEEELKPINELELARRKQEQPWYAPPQGGRYCCILLEAWQDKVTFPDLRQLAKNHYKQLKPDRVLVEKKVSGHSLIQELRRSNVPVYPIPADRSKFARAHTAAVVLEDGCVFYMPRRWSDEVIERCARASFAKGDPGNDMPDTVVHAWNYLRKHWHLQTTDDDNEEDEGDYEENAPKLFN